MKNVSTLLGIVTRNRAEILPKSILSALAQTAPNLRVAVMDDNSTDNTQELVSRFPQVVWERWSPSRGYMAARNYWMASAPEDYFASLDDDAWFIQGDEIEIAVDYLEKHESVAAVAFDILSADRPNRVSRCQPRPAAMFIGCGHVLRLAAVRSVGVYETTAGLWGGEEKDLSLRLMDAGYEIAFLPGVHVWHDKTPLARDLANQYPSSVCNDLTMTLRRTPGYLLPLAVMSKFYRHFLFSVRNGLVKPAFAGLGLFFRSVPEIWRSRKPVKASTLRTFIKLRAG
jgi:GT2 family glycosyltransferase